MNRAVSKSVFMLLVLGMASARVHAAFSTNDQGTSAAQFLKLGAGAKATAMGDAAAGLGGDSTAIYWNPAGLNGLEGKSATVMHAMWFEDIYYDWASFAMPVKKAGVFGLGVQYLSYGSIKKLDGAGIETGELNPADLCVSLSYAKNLRGVDIGVNVKYISLKLTNTASAYAADIGARYKVKNLLNDKLTLGLAAQNMGTKIKFMNEEDPLPFNIKLGGAYEIKNNWLAVLDINAPIDNAAAVGAGTEYVCKVNDKMDLFGRAGYSIRNLHTGPVSGVTAGAGIKYLDYSFDYAFVPYGDLGNTQRLSLSLKF